MNILNLPIIFLILVFLTGCGVPKKVIPRIETRYYHHCIKPLADLQQADANVTRSTLSGGLQGALAGAMIGFFTSGKIEGALIGLGIGTLSGSVIGYTFAKVDQIADEDRRFASIRITANQDLSKANRVQLYAYESLTCYIDEFNMLQDKFSNNLILSSEYEERFKEINKAMKSLGLMIGDIQKDILRTEKEFNSSINKTANKPHDYASSSYTKIILPQKTHSTKKRLGELQSNLKQKRLRLKAEQDKNDEDLTAMMDDFAGKLSPPKQNVQKISVEYGQRYDTAVLEIQELHRIHKEAMQIMFQTATETGIDVI